MTLSRQMVALVALISASVCLLPVYMAYEDSIMVVEMKNISLNLSPGYNISKNGSVAMAAQTIAINSTDPAGKNASVMLMYFNVEGDESQQINQTEFSNFMETMLLGALKVTGGMETGTTTVMSPQGENVTLHTILMPGTKTQPGKETVLAFWDLDDFNHAILTSELDQNTSARIVETLAIIP
jgi:hypothetical protein